MTPKIEDGLETITNEVASGKIEEKLERIKSEKSTEPESQFTETTINPVVETPPPSMKKILEEAFYSSDASKIEQAIAQAEEKGINDEVRQVIISNCQNLPHRLRPYGSEKKLLQIGLRYDSNNVKLLEKLSYIYQNDHDYKNGIDVARKLVNTDPTGSHEGNLVRFLHMKVEDIWKSFGKADEVASIYRELKDLDNYFNYDLEMGKLMAKEGKFSEAENFLMNHFNDKKRVSDEIANAYKHTDRISRDVFGMRLTDYYLNKAKGVSDVDDKICFWKLAKKADKEIAENNIRRQFLDLNKSYYNETDKDKLYNFVD